MYDSNKSIQIWWMVMLRHNCADCIWNNKQKYMILYFVAGSSRGCKSSVFFVLFLSVLRHSRPTLLAQNRCEVLCEHCRRVVWYRCWWYVAAEKEGTDFLIFYKLLYMCSIWACHRNLLSTMRRIRWCSVTFSIFWPSSDSLNDKSESWCFCRVVIVIDFVFTGLMSMWLMLHHTKREREGEKQAGRERGGGGGGGGPYYDVVC